ncbi:hypothetical protein VPH35_019997 [Triticum aestivum]
MYALGYRRGLPDRPFSLHLAGQLLFRHGLQQRHRERVQQGRVPRREGEAAEDNPEPHDRDRSNEVQPRRPGPGDKLREGAERDEARARPVSHRVPELARASVRPPVPPVPGLQPGQRVPLCRTRRWKSVAVQAAPLSERLGRLAWRVQF